MTTEPPRCTNPGCAKPIKQRKPGPGKKNGQWRRDREGRCDACHIRWRAAGEPDKVPPPMWAGTGQVRSLRSERGREQVLALAKQGTHPAVIARQTGWNVSTVRRWLRDAREKGELNMPSDAMQAGSALLYASPGAHDRRPERKEPQPRYNGRDLDPREAKIVSDAHQEACAREWEQLMGKKEAA